STANRGASTLGAVPIGALAVPLGAPLAMAVGGLLSVTMVSTVGLRIREIVRFGRPSTVVPATAPGFEVEPAAATAQSLPASERPAADCGLPLPILSLHPRSRTVSMAKQPQLQDYSAAAARDLFRTRYGIDERALSELLDVALSRGGDYADLYFEHRQTSSISFEESKVKTASGGITQGLGVRVLAGDSTGYAYTENLSMESMRQAAATAAKICDRRDRVGPVNVAEAATPDRYHIDKPSIEIPSAEKLSIIHRADEAARAYDPSITRVNVSFVEEVKHVLVATSDGRLSADFQPMLRFNVQCLSEVGSSRQTAVDGGGGRLGMEYFVEHPPEAVAREAARQAVTLQKGVEAPAGYIPVVLGAGESGILLHEAVGHGLEADFNRKKTSNYSDRI